jgi:hypothetical protein
MTLIEKWESQKKSLSPKKKERKEVKLFQKNQNPNLWFYKSAA